MDISRLRVCEPRQVGNGITVHETARFHQPEIRECQADALVRVSLTWWLACSLNKRETIATLISYLSEPPDNDADFRCAHAHMGALFLSHCQGGM